MPQPKSLKQQLYKKLIQLKTNSNYQHVFGGDWNYVHNPEIDRVSLTQAQQTPPQLSEYIDFIEVYQLQDSLNSLMKTIKSRVDITMFQQKHHTFFRNYSSSRIDRFYLSKSLVGWVKKHSTNFPPAQSDHKELYITIRDPHQVLKIKKSARLYKNIGPERSDLINYLNYVRNQGFLIHQWDKVKKEMSKIIRNIKKDDRRKRKQARQQHNRRQKTHFKRLFDMVILHLKNLNLAHSISFFQDQQAHKRFYRIGRSINTDDKYNTKLFKKISKKKTFNNIISNIDLPDSIRKNNQSLNQLDNANRMQLLWKPVFNNPGSNSYRCIKEQFLNNFHPTTLNDKQKDNLLLPISESEIIKAIKSLSKGKTAGPDGLSNDFYIDYQESITPILQLLFQHILDNEIYPTSFQYSYILPIKKNHDSSNAMDYRPISLLNSDYKIFTKILKTRLENIMKTIISPHQGGFVPKRRIEERIHLMLSKIYSLQQNKSHPGVIILLDIAKAYDSVNRTYLFELLQIYGFPIKFINLIKKMHCQTRYSFIVNGITAKSSESSSGIRQGCPLAPFLFLMAMEPLVSKIDKSSQLDGIVLHSNQETKPSKISLFVDDSAIFLNHFSQLSYLKNILHDFAQLSGLSLQEHKCYLLSHPINHTMFKDYNYQVVEPQGVTRYLGIYIGMEQVNKKNWDLSILNLQTRLRLATSKHTNFLQRIQIIKAIVFPKILYTASYFAPSRATIQKLNHIIFNFIWKGKFSTTQKIKGLINRQQLAAPIKLGGLNLPSISYLLEQHYLKLFLQSLLNTTNINIQFLDYQNAEILEEYGTILTSAKEIFTFNYTSTSEQTSENIKPSINHAISPFSQGKKTLTSLLVTPLNKTFISRM